MKILARGEKNRVTELQQKLAGLDIEWVLMDASDNQFPDAASIDIVFDLYFDEAPNHFEWYAQLKNKLVVVSAVKKNLAQTVQQYGRAVNCVLVGINALSTFINRSLAEVSLRHVAEEPLLKEAFGKLNWEYKLVNDRVGMITPRIVLMIINEACYTMQEGTANMKDIDISMKLGTNYPFGPFEWGDKIGIKHVYETLEAVYQDTHDERYKICPMLKTLYLQNGSFYPNQQ
jgi:3-hydroxybutyryl-CoA dehydrogenase